MRLVHPLWEGMIVFEENRINLLVVEDGACLSRLILELRGQTEGEDGGFVLSKDYEPIDIGKKLDLITDVLSLDLNKKKFMNKLMEQLTTRAMGEDHYMETMALRHRLVSYGSALCDDFSLPLSFEADFSLTALWKAMEFQIAEEGLTLPEKIIEYMAVSRTFLKEQCFVFVNLKSYVSEAELELLYQEIFYGKYTVLLLEHAMGEEVLSCEKIRIIDKDLCEILVNH